MLVLIAFVLWLVVCGLLLLFAVAFTPLRVLTVHFPTAHPPEQCLGGRTAPLPGKRHRPIGLSPRKRWRRTPGMQSGLPPPIITTG